MDISHNLVLIIGKRLYTNLSCYCHSSIRRKHMFFLWPQGTVALCAELSILQGSSEDIFTGADKCYGFSYQRDVCSCKWRLPAALLLKPPWQVQAVQSQQQQAGPDVLVLTLVEELAASQPNIQLQRCLGLLQRQGQEQLAQQGYGMPTEGGPWPKLIYPVKWKKFQ